MGRIYDKITAEKCFRHIQAMEKKYPNEQSWDMQVSPEDELVMFATNLTDELAAAYVRSCTCEQDGYIYHVCETIVVSK